MLTAMAMTPTKAIGNDDYDTNFNVNVYVNGRAHRYDAYMRDVEGARGGDGGECDWESNENVDGGNDDCDN